MMPAVQAVQHSEAQRAPIASDRLALALPPFGLLQAVRAKVLRLSSLSLWAPGTVQADHAQQQQLACYAIGSECQRLTAAAQADLQPTAAH